MLAWGWDIMTKPLLGGLLALLLVIGPLAPAAMADVNGVAAFDGWLRVGDGFNGECSKNNYPDVRGPGLVLLPVFQQDVRMWRFDATFEFVGASHAARPAGLYSGLLWACGWMDGPLPGLTGPACLAGTAYHGRGGAYAYNALSSDDFALKLFDVSWQLTAGAVVPLLANYQVYDGSGPAKNEKAGGSFYALMHASPVEMPEGCLFYEAMDHIILGAAAFVHDNRDNRMADPPPPMNKMCANQDDTACPQPGPGK